MVAVGTAIPDGRNHAVIEPVRVLQDVRAPDDLLADPVRAQLSHRLVGEGVVGQLVAVVRDPTHQVGVRGHPLADPEDRDRHPGPGHDVQELLRQCGVARGVEGERHPRARPVAVGHVAGGARADPSPTSAAGVPGPGEVGAAVLAAAVVRRPPGAVLLVASVAGDVGVAARPRPRPQAPRTAATAPASTKRRRLERRRVASWSAVVARVAEGVPAGLGEHAQPVRSARDLDPGHQLTGAGVDGVHLGVVATRQPQEVPVGRDAAHVR